MADGRWAIGVGICVHRQTRLSTRDRSSKETIECAFRDPDLAAFDEIQPTSYSMWSSSCAMVAWRRSIISAGNCSRVRVWISVSTLILREIDAVVDLLVGDDHDLAIEEFRTEDLPRPSSPADHDGRNTRPWRRCRSSPFVFRKRNRSSRSPKPVAVLIADAGRDAAPGIADVDVDDSSGLFSQAISSSRSIENMK